MQVHVRYLGGMKFEATARNHRIVCDQPEEDFGNNEGMTPTELLLSSLGACAGHYAAQYLSGHSLPADTLEVRVEAQRVTQPSRIAAFRVSVSNPGLDERHQSGLLRAVHLCLIHNTLTHLPGVDVTVVSHGTGERTAVA
jgi:putative redox protein